MQRPPRNLGPNRRLLSITAAVVVGLHVLVLFLWGIDGRVDAISQRPDLHIEFSTAAPVPSATAAPVAAPATQPVTPPTPPPLRPAPSKPVAPTPTPPEPTAATSAAPTPSAPTDPEPRITAPAASGRDANILPSTLSADADYTAAELHNPKPIYPFTAVRQGLQGRVLLLVEVQADGRAGRVSIDQSSGHAILDASAMNTVRRWRFIPARKDGVFYAQSIRVPIDFNLQSSR